MSKASAVLSQNRLQDISRTLVDARRAATALPGFPGDLPDSFADAYAVQQMSCKNWADDVAGWKVGGVPPDFVEKFGETHLVGPIFARSVKFIADGGEVSMPVFAGGFAAIEPELIVQIGETRSADRLFIGAEIASSPLPAINDIGPIAVICDFGNNNGMVVGPEIVDWREQGAEPVSVECIIDDRSVGVRTISDMIVSADQMIAVLLAHTERNDIEVPAGTYISTGAITGIHEADPGAVSHISFGQYGAFSISLEAAIGV